MQDNYYTKGQNIQKEQPYVYLKASSLAYEINVDADVKYVILFLHVGYRSYGSGSSLTDIAQVMFIPELSMGVSVGISNTTTYSKMASYNWEQGKITGNNFQKETVGQLMSNNSIAILFY